MGKKESLLYVIFKGIFTLTCIWLVLYYVFGIQYKPASYAFIHEGFQQKSSPLFTEAYAITLSKYPDRFPKIKASADAAGVSLKPWEGVIITADQKDTLPFMGVGTTNYTDRNLASFNLGVIGAYLAHRNLLEHIRDSGSTSLGTFILEDDAYIPADFYQRLANVEKEIPEDWDYIFFRKMSVEGKKISENVIKLDKDMSGMKNWGFWAFLVKNASIPERILPKMEHMLDVPDIQMAKFADKLNMYLIDPPIVDLNQETASKSVVSDIDMK
jgi:GR25 family glycosyltransferase involved in LPS biosynthesis